MDFLEIFPSVLQVFIAIFLELSSSSDFLLKGAVRAFSEGAPANLPVPTRVNFGFFSEGQLAINMYRKKSRSRAIIYGKHREFVKLG